MASEKVQKLIEAINGLTVLEIAELSKELQDVWGVSAAVPVAAALPAAGAVPAAEAEAAPEEEEQTEFDVILKEIGPTKVPVIKVVRELTGLGLKEAKDVVEAAPRAIKEAVSKEEAEEAREKLEAVSAVVEIK